MSVTAGLDDFRPLGRGKIRGPKVNVGKGWLSADAWALIDNAVHVSIRVSESRPEYCLIVPANADADDALSVGPTGFFSAAMLKRHARLHGFEEASYPVTANNGGLLFKMRRRQAA